MTRSYFLAGLTVLLMGTSGSASCQTTSASGAAQAYVTALANDGWPGFRKYSAWYQQLWKSGTQGLPQSMWKQTQERIDSLVKQTIAHDRSVVLGTVAWSDAAGCWAFIRPGAAARVIETRSTGNGEFTTFIQVSFPTEASAPFIMGDYAVVSRLRKATLRTKVGHLQVYDQCEIVRGTRDLWSPSPLDEHRAEDIVGRVYPKEAYFPWVAVSRGIGIRGVNTTWKLFIEKKGVLERLLRELGFEIERPFEHPSEGYYEDGVGASPPKAWETYVFGKDPGDRPRFLLFESTSHSVAAMSPKFAGQTVVYDATLIIKSTGCNKVCQDLTLHRNEFASLKGYLHQEAFYASQFYCPPPPGDPEWDVQPAIDGLDRKERAVRVTFAWDARWGWQLRQ